MIRTLDTLKLARTKLRTRKIRLLITLVIMSLLFASLVFISLVTTGATSSLKSFGKEGLGSRYLVSASPVLYVPYENDALSEQLRPLQKTLIAQKKQLAKTLGIAYDEKSDATLPFTTVQTGPGTADVQEYINTNSPDVLKALNTQNNAIPGISLNEFNTLARSQNAKNVYVSTNPNYGSFSSNVKVLLDGKENYNPNTKQNFSEPTGIQSIESLGWNQISDDLLQPFVIEGQSLKTGNEGSIPITAPYSAAQELLGLKKLPETASSKEKLERLELVRSTVPGKNATLCYRNDSSQALLQTAISQQADIAANKNKKDYIAPSLQYNLPTVACGAVTIKSDKRTTDEKKADTSQKRFDETFTSYSEPAQGIITVRIIGITPDIAYGSSFSAGSIFSGIFGSTVGAGWFTPTSAINSGTLVSNAQGGSISERSLENLVYYAEFATLAQAKDFIKANNCDLKFGSSFDPASKKCIGSSTPFFINAYGNNAGAIEELQSSVWKIARFVILGVVVIAVVVMMGTLGKIIADSRRETAVFRALGAKRLDISQIYFTYTLIVSILISIIAFAVGSIGAKIIDHMFSKDLSVSAVITYNAADTSKEFALFGINPLHMLIIIGLIIASGLVSALIPLLTNMRRNPIRDMRDES